MAIANRFRHTLVIERLGASSGSTPRGHAIKAFADHHTTKGLVQERTGQEVNGPDLGGTVVTDALIFLAVDEDVTVKDVIRNAANGRRYEPLFTRDPGGRGRHIEVDARWIRA